MEDPSTPQQYFNTKEAAGYLRISCSTLAKRRIYGGGPRFSKFGAAVRYAKTDLDSFMAEKSVVSTTELSL